MSLLTMTHCFSICHGVNKMPCCIVLHAFCKFIQTSLAGKKPMMPKPCPIPGANEDLLQ